MKAFKVKKTLLVKKKVEENFPKSCHGPFKQALKEIFFL